MAALLLDENLPRSAVDALVRANHDVLHMAQAEPSADDRLVLAMARSMARVLVTFDSDFGDLVYRHGEPAPPGILYLRLHPIVGAAAATLVIQALADNVQGQFVVCTPDGLRRRPLPTPS
jgi:predicted nuclease of predicted toxin-antitoxin system